MTSFSERMRLRAKASRESKDFRAEKSFAEDIKKLVPDFQKPPLRGSFFEKSSGSRNVEPSVASQSKLPYSNRRAPAPPKASSAVSDPGFKNKVPLKEINILNNKVSPHNNVFRSLKAITVSPPEPGCLYPCLAGMEVVTDTEDQSSNDHSLEEKQSEKENLNESTASDSSENSVQHFHIENRDASFNHLDNHLKRRSNDSDSSNERKSISNELNVFLESAFCSDSSFGPSPAKSICNDSLETSVSTSFTYQVGSPVKAATVDNKMPTLTHSISFSKKQPNLTSTPVNVGKDLKENSKVCQPIVEQNELSLENTEMTTSSKMKKFEALVKTHENVISQAGGALSLCFSSPEFTNSTQRVEAERLLLIASHKKKAVLNEIEKLKHFPDQHLKPVINNSSLTLSDIFLPIKSDMVLRAAKANLCHYLVGVVKSNGHVFGTALVSTSKENLVQNSRNTVYVKFPTKIILPEITPDFKVTIEIYDLVIPAAVSNGKSNSSAKKESCKLWITPKKPKSNLKLRKAVSRSMLKSSNFKIIGSGVFTLNDVKSSKINLIKMSVPSLLEGTVCFRSSCDITASLEYRGFLTMFDDISGFGAWHRRWCLLSGNQLSFWKYPEDENSKEVLGSIDLSTCTSRNISAVSRDICARLNTFLMECIRPKKAGDSDSQILTVKGSQTVVRYLLSADTRESRNEWCDNLNQVLSMINQWKK